MSTSLSWSFHLACEQALGPGPPPPPPNPEPRPGPRACSQANFTWCQWRKLIQILLLYYGYLHNTPLHMLCNMDISIIIYTMNWLLRALWLVVAYDLSEYRRTADVIEKLFSLFFFPTWRTVSKMFARLLRIEQVKASKNFLVEAVYKREKEETETRGIPGDLKNT